jgi:hypothetical protein
METFLNLTQSDSVEAHQCDDGESKRDKPEVQHGSLLFPGGS